MAPTPHAPRAAVAPTAAPHLIGIALVMGLGPAHAADPQFDRAVDEARQAAQAGSVWLTQFQDVDFAKDPTGV